jgi:hypothetical protein
MYVYYLQSSKDSKALDNIITDPVMQIFGTNKTVELMIYYSTKWPVDKKSLHSTIGNIPTTREYLRGMYHCTIDLLFDWFGISCMTTDNFCFYLQNRQIQTSQTGGQWYSDTSPFNNPCYYQYNLRLMKLWMGKMASWQNALAPVHWAKYTATKIGEKPPRELAIAIAFSTANVLHKTANIPRRDDKDFYLKNGRTKLQFFKILIFLKK